MIDNISDLEVGAKVYYRPNYFKPDEHENGIVKEIRENNQDSVFVTFNCNSNWKNYREYTGCLTRLKDLSLGWL